MYLLILWTYQMSWIWEIAQLHLPQVNILRGSRSGWREEGILTSRMGGYEFQRYPTIQVVKE